MTAGAAMLAASLVVTSLFVVARRNRVVWPRTVVARWLLPGTFVGLSYVALFEAFYRGTVSRRRAARRDRVAVGRRVLGAAPAALGAGRRDGSCVGAALVVAGGVLIAVVR